MQSDNLGLLKTTLNERWVKKVTQRSQGLRVAF
ncbi:hypothetical protein MFFDBJGM_03889 [Pectobacterium versatile]|nr:hypothetical protein MFFDBJGM_03889 [Pectobacterium versatile]